MQCFRFLPASCQKQLWLGTLSNIKKNAALIWVSSKSGLTSPPPNFLTYGALFESPTFCNFWGTFVGPFWAKKCPKTLGLGTFGKQRGVAPPVSTKSSKTLVHKKCTMGNDTLQIKLLKLLTLLLVVHLG